MLENIVNFYLCYHRHYTYLPPHRYKHWVVDYTFRAFQSWHREPPDSIFSWLIKWPEYYLYLNKIKNRSLRMGVFLSYPLTFFFVMMFCISKYVIGGILILCVALTLRLYFFTMHKDGTVQKVWNGDLK